MQFIAPTATRVQANTSHAINQRLSQQTERRVNEAVQQSAHGIDQKLQTLRSEFDVERAIEIEAPSMIAAGIAAGTWVDKRFIAVSAFAAGMLLLHSAQGWYPLLPIFRRAGLRATREIADEAYALKRARGDFEAIGQGSPEEIAARAYAASAW
jgi:hypothetical protein